MVSVCFITPDGDRIVREAEPGARLLEVGQAAGMPLEGTCEGQMACSTCHVIVAAEWFAKLAPAGEDTRPTPLFWTGPKRSESITATGRAPIVKISRKIPPTPVAAP